MADSGKPLLIVESPTKAQTIRRLLGKQYEVAASYGHVRDLPEKGLGVQILEEGGQYRFVPVYEVQPGKKAHLQILHKQVAEASQVWLATDEDREGEAIAWHLCALLGISPHEPVRIAFHEITRRALEQALKSPRPISMSLVEAQQARRLLDRLVGYEISPLLWRIFPKAGKKSALSAGRVQSVALRLIVERERAIAGHQPEVSYSAEAHLVAEPPFKATLVEPDLPDLETAQEYLRQLVGQALQVTKVEKKTRRRSPPPPFTTSTLQQEAQRRLGFSLQRTMRTAQSLYEKGLITYMRTDSVHLAPEALQAIHAAIAARYGPEAVSPRTYETRSAHAQEAHEAIRPTNPSLDEAGDTADEQKLYALIWRRTLASQMPEALYEETVAQLLPEKPTEPLLRFEAKGAVLVRPGFLQLYSQADDEEEKEKAPPLPLLEPGQKWSWNLLRVVERFSAPPARYTEGTLVRELESRGIGRPSTYAPTVETLFKRGYIRRENLRVNRPPYTELLLHPDGQSERRRQTPAPELQKNKLLPTELGIQVLDFLVARFPDILDYEFTARVEAELDQIAAQKLDWQAMLNAFYQRFVAELETARTTRNEYRHRLLGYDPVTQQPIFLHVGRNGPYVALGEKGDPHYRTASVPSRFKLDQLSLENALELLSFPRPVGSYEGEPIWVHRGPYGYYLRHKGANYPLLPGMSPFSLTEEEAIEAIEARRHQQANRVLREFPEAGIRILRGRYGPYIQYGGRNYTLPRGVDPTHLTVEACQQLMAEKASKPTKAPRKASSRKE